MKSYNLRILMTSMNYSIPAIMGTVGVLLVIVSTSMSFAFAGNIYCTKLANSDPNTWCVGTDSNDVIGANGLKHNILGLGGNDRIAQALVMTVSVAVQVTIESAEMTVTMRYSET